MNRNHMFVQSSFSLQHISIWDDGHDGDDDDDDDCDYDDDDDDDDEEEQDVPKATQSK